MVRTKQTCFDYCSLPFIFQTLQPASIVPVRVVVSLPRRDRTYFLAVVSANWLAS